MKSMTLPIQEKTLLLFILFMYRENDVEQEEVKHEEFEQEEEQWGIITWIEMI